ncbi:SLATT domain-containing protein [Empedobacter stercoris]|uniref:SLATT domain-containing protein n=2 Tax=Empedobacter TaxID=59734 RepID=A0ABY8VC41_9FLAO|nr:MULTISPECIES: SLATT domain-containing protein [Empedobacter]UWX68059.1 SLATT domain-containing protein [Empedobacter stercoris]WIH98218.1 SLATT domain-containing protein [Empedobacter falsenii]
MNNDKLKNYIAKTAYNIGFGAKKNFASFDIVNNLNEYISILSMIIGVLALVFEIFNAKIISATLLIFGIIGLYINKFDKGVEEYEKYGVLYLKLYNQLHLLYNEVDASDDILRKKILEKVKHIEEEFYNNNMSKQVYFSDLLAHFKFYYQFQTEWIVKELNLTFWKDKIPNSLKVIIILFLIIVLIVVCFSQLFMKNICN